VANAPLNEPTAVRAALAMTMDVLLMESLLAFSPLYIRRKLDAVAKDAKAAEPTTAGKRR
jgi:hypothetical protein